MKKLLSLLVVGVIVIGALCGNAEANLLTNPGVEDSPDFTGWGVGAVGDATIDTVTYHGGSQSALATQDPGEIWGSLSQWVEDITPGVDYTISVWIKTDNVTNHYSHAKIAWYDKTTSPWTKIGGDNVIGTNVGETTDWVQRSETITAPTGATSLQLRLWAGDADAETGEAKTWWDDASVTPEPATMVLLGLGGVGLLIRRRRRS